MVYEEPKNVQDLEFLHGEQKFWVILWLHNMHNAACQQKSSIVHKFDVKHSFLQHAESNCFFHMNISVYIIQCLWSVPTPADPTTPLTKQISIIA